MREQLELLVAVERIKNKLVDPTKNWAGPAGFAVHKSDFRKLGDDLPNFSFCQQREALGVPRAWITSPVCG
jgi:hypothetical protein